MENNHWQIKKSKNDQFYFNFVASNGQILVTSEMYTQKHNVVNAIAVICKACRSMDSLQVIDKTDVRDSE